MLHSYMLENSLQWPPDKKRLEEYISKIPFFMFQKIYFRFAILTFGGQHFAVKYLSENPKFVQNSLKIIG